MSEIKVRLTLTLTLAHPSETVHTGNMSHFTNSPISRNVWLYEFTEA